MTSSDRLVRAVVLAGVSAGAVYRTELWTVVAVVLATDAVLVAPGSSWPLRRIGLAILACVLVGLGMRSGFEAPALVGPESWRPLAFSPDTRLLVAQDGELLDVHDRTTGEVVRSYRGWRPEQAVISPDNQWMVVSDGSSARVLPVSTDFAPIQGRFLARDVTAIALSGDGRLLLLGSSAMHVELWETSRWTRVSRIEGAITGSFIRAVGINHDGSQIAAATSTWMQRWRDTTTGWSVEREQRGPVTGFRFLPDGRLLCILGRPGSSFLWEEPTREFGEPRGELTAVSPDGRFLATVLGPMGTSLMQPVVSEAGTERSVWLPIHHSHAIECAFTPDSAQLLTVGGRGRVHTWDVSTGDEVSSGVTARQLRWQRSWTSLLIAFGLWLAYWAFSHRDQEDPMRHVAVAATVSAAGAAGFHAGQIDPLFAGLAPQAGLIAALVLTGLATGLLARRRGDTRGSMMCIGVLVPAVLVVGWRFLL